MQWLEPDCLVLYFYRSIYQLSANCQVAWQSMSLGFLICKMQITTALTSQSVMMTHRRGHDDRQCLSHTRSLLLLHSWLPCTWELYKHSQENGQKTQAALSARGDRYNSKTCGRPAKSLRDQTKAVPQERKENTEGQTWAPGGGPGRWPGAT